MGKIKSKTLHELLMMHFKECFPLRELGNYREIRHNRNEKTLYIDGHGTFQEVEDYAIVPINAVPNAPKDTGEGIHHYTPSDVMLYINRKTY